MKKALILTLLLMTASLANAQEPVPADSTAAKDPSRALLLSFVPGGGQLYNQRPLKALLFAGTFIYFGVEYVGAQSDYEANPTTSLHRTRNDKVWLMALTWTLNIIDAYVDAQLWDFDNYPVEQGELEEIPIIKPKESDNNNDDE